MAKKIAQVFVIIALILVNISLISYSSLILFDQAKAISHIQNITSPFTKKV